ncbi:2'-5' RNA ligase family protein [Polaromonas sp.]|uniref:2'-5' RNA ligase family protein n=1 Tax=Polaromonas sp. TaxID=1869339 RepID=UPI00286C98A1|nr:2'-5' RNA ligase family protein [Polaromonas sp.]
MRHQQQALLPGLEEAPPLKHRLFFALVPDAEAAARLAQVSVRLRKANNLAGKAIITEHLHITLHHLGDYPEPGVPPELLEKARAAGDSIRMPPFEVRFDGVMSFFKTANHPFVLRGKAGLERTMAFQEALGKAMVTTQLGHCVDARFTPHMTLTYDKRHVPEQAIEPVSWMARELVLVHSLIGQTRHIHLARWPLRG